MPRFDDIFTEVHAGNGVNVFEFDSRTAPSHPPSMTWAEAVDIIGRVVHHSMESQHVILDEDKQRILNAWHTMLRGV